MIGRKARRHGHGTAQSRAESPDPQAEECPGSEPFRARGCTRVVTRTPALALIAILVTACGGGPSSPATGAPTGGPTAAATSSADSASARIAGWTGDLEAIVPGLERHHPDPYHSVAKEILVEAIDDLEASIPTATDDELMAGVLRVVAMVSSAGRDAHTGAYVWGSGTYPTHTLPLRLWVFPEGVAVVDALPPYEALVGRVIASLDGHPIADVLEALEPLTPRDNPATVTLLAPRFLLTTEILHGAGLIDDPGAVELSFDDDPATAIDVAAIPTADYNDWATPYGLHLPTRPDVPWLARSEEPIWTRLDADGTLFIQYNRVTRLAGPDLDALRTAIAEPAVRRTIVDIRHNFGGETFGYPPVADALVERASAWSGGLFLITGRNTFSAASLFAADLTARADVTVVGEPMGGSPALYGNADDVALSWSGLVVSVATELFEPVPGDDRLELPVDLAAPISLADFLAGRDPAMAAIADAPTD